eukprot:gene7996-718_t
MDRLVVRRVDVMWACWWWFEMNTIYIKQAFEVATAAEEQGNYANARLHYLECAQHVLTLLHTGADHGVSYGESTDGVVGRWYAYLRTCINKSEELWRLLPSQKERTQTFRRLEREKSINSSDIAGTQDRSLHPMAARSSSLSGHASPAASKNGGTTIPNRIPSQRKIERKPTQRNTYQVLENLRREHERRSMERSEKDQAEQRVKMRQQTLREVYEDRARYRVQPVDVSQEFIDSVIEFDASQHASTFNTRTALKQTSLTKDAIVEHIKEVLSQEQHPVTQQLEWDKSSVVRKFHDRGLLRDTQRLIDSGVQMILSAYPELERPACSDTKLDQQPIPQHVQQLRNRAATLFSRISRSSSSFEQDPSSTPSRDTEPIDVENIVREEIQAFIFDSSVWATLRFLSPEDMHVKEARLRSKCEAYMPVTIQESILDPILRLLPDDENAPQGYEPYSKAIEILHSMPTGMSPVQKVRVLCNVAHTAVETVESHTKKQNGKAYPVSCDVLLNIFEHVVLKSGRFAFIYEIFGMQEFIDPSLLRGEEGYILCSFAIIVDQLTQDPRCLSHEGISDDEVGGGKQLPKDQTEKTPSSTENDDQNPEDESHFEE